MTMTNASESYNGYSNRETWAFNLHWQNDQGLYETVKEWARDIMADLDDDGNDLDRGDGYGSSVTDYALGNHIIEQARELWSDYAYSREARSDNDPIVMWERETGSVWRVDPTEVGEAVREALDNG